MKIAFVSTILHYPWGGADVLWTRTAERALAANHDVLLALSATVSSHPRVTALAAAGARLHLRSGLTHEFGNRDRLRHAAGHFLRSRRSLTAALARFQPDVLFLCQGGTFDFLVEDGLRRWLAPHRTAYVPICQSNDARNSLPSSARAVARNFFAGAAHTVFVSTHNRDLAGRQINAPVPRAKVLPNPVERVVAEIPWPDSPTARLAVVARIASDPKGLDIMIAALERLTTNRAWEVSLFGRGPDETALRDEIVGRGLAERVLFRGYEPDLQRIWSTHHLLLLPSRCEGCALALLEAVACGRPVLTTDTGGASDWIEPGVNGWICPPGDVDALATTLQSALERFDRWPEFGQAAQRLFRTRYVAEPDAQLLALVN